ncbi:hypothetical protein [Nesterenkonia aerolata]|uniref:Uncharacterized protein n=1 Tax=Nesterenkonia aerolata TaxID=3074079 RepID=A0ABU2DNA7_9MICC|nr:hypothetical protein [Nesterenkonia sp. LY-0111]MDR8017988.1 hypothetical protein [Nesterenkonia sp. LY-0111]
MTTLPQTSDNGPSPVLTPVLTPVLIPTLTPVLTQVQAPGSDASRLLSR